MAQTPKEKAFKLLDKYNDPKTTDDQIDRIVTQLYNLGYVIRPARGGWGLVERRTGNPVVLDVCAASDSPHSLVEDTPLHLIPNVVGYVSILEDATTLLAAFCKPCYAAMPETDGLEGVTEGEVQDQDNLCYRAECSMCGEPLAPLF